jgi:hypothetical protein
MRNHNRRPLILSGSSRNKFRDRMQTAREQPVQDRCREIRLSLVILGPSHSEIASDNPCSRQLSAKTPKSSLQSELPKRRSSSLGKTSRTVAGAAALPVTRDPFGARDLESGAESAESLELGPS